MWSLLRVGGAAERLLLAELCVLLVWLLLFVLGPGGTVAELFGLFESCGCTSSGMG